MNHFWMEVHNLIIEIARPIALIFCILSLYAVFHAAFLDPAGDVRQRIWDGGIMLGLSAAICLIGGLVFRADAEARGGRDLPLTATLPVQLFVWGASAMLMIFVVSWCLETYFVWYRDVRF
jgi:hypothetical protein